MKKSIFLLIALALTGGLQAQDCVLPLRVELDEDFTDVPASAAKYLENALTRIATENGLSTSSPATPFVLSLHADILDQSTLAGPPMQTTYNLGVTLYIVDAVGKKKFATTYMEVNGVGQGQTKAYMDAFRRLNARNQNVRAFVSAGKQKMMAYYDTQYPQIIEESRRLCAMQQYEEAIAMLISVPLCSAGGDACTSEAVKVYKIIRDRYNLALLNRARTLWASMPTQDGARLVAPIIAQIDPESSCYGDTQKLLAEIKAQVRSDIDFEVREKYHDQIDIQKQTIECARAVGVAYGSHQQPQTTNILWAR